MDNATLDLNLKPSGIARYRKAPLIAGVITFGILIFYLIMQLSHRTDATMDAARTQDHQASISTPSEGQPTHYWFEDEAYKTVPAAQAALPPLLPEAAEAPPETKGGIAAILPAVRDAALAKAQPPRLTQEDASARNQTRALDQEKMEFEAIRAPARVPVSTQGSSPMMASPAASGSTAATPPPAPSTLKPQDDQSDKEAFLHAKTDQDRYLNHRKMAALSASELKAGTVIPAALVTGLNSDLPGSVIGQVRENVYDTVTGNQLLVPQGAKLIGSYDARVSFGQNRALVVWDRLIFPDGSSLTLERMQGADSSGFSGFSDEVNNHYGRIYGNALLMSLLGSGYELLNQDTSGTGSNTSTVDTVAAAIGQQLAQVSNEMIRKNLSIQPTIIIKAGYKFNVMVMKDVILEPLE